MIEILKYENNLLSDWDDFVEHSNNGTIFHKQKFLSYHINRRFDDFSLIFKKRGKIIAVVLTESEEHFPSPSQGKILSWLTSTAYGPATLSFRHAACS